MSVGNTTHSSAQEAGRLGQVGMIPRAFRNKTPWLLFGFSVLYLVCTCTLAHRKLLWYDELLTVHICELPDLRDIWSPALTRVDMTPPLYHLVTRGSHALFGVNPVASRLPAILGFWVMSLCLFWFVARRCASLYAWTSLLFPLSTGAYWYAYEARPYGLVLGCSAIALLCWQAASEGRRRALSLSGLSLSLAVAVASHYYAFLMLIPLALGELVHSWSRRKLDLLVWVALALGLAPLLLYGPLIQQASAEIGAFWAPKPSLSSVTEFYANLLRGTLPPLVALLIYLGIGQAGSPAGPPSEERAALKDPPFHEVVAAVGIAALPVFGYALAFITGAFLDRYVLPSVIGLSVLLAFVAHRLGRRSVALGSVLVVLFFGWFLANESLALRRSEDSFAGQRESNKLLGSTTYGNDLPVVVPDNVSYLKLAYYVPADLAPRLYCMSRSARINEGLRALRIAPQYHFEDYRAFVGSHKQFFLLRRNDAADDWPISALLAEGARIEMKTWGKSEVIYFVDTGA